MKGFLVALLTPVFPCQAHEDQGGVLMNLAQEIEEGLYKEFNFSDGEADWETEDIRKTIIELRSSREYSIEDWLKDVENENAANEIFELLLWRMILEQVSNEALLWYVRAENEDEIYADMISRLVVPIEGWRRERDRIGALVYNGRIGMPVLDEIANLRTVYLVDRSVLPLLTLARYREVTGIDLSDDPVFSESERQEIEEVVSQARESARDTILARRAASELRELEAKEVNEDLNQEEQN